MRTLADLLKRARLRRRLTLRVVSERSGVALGYIHELENGVKQNPTADILSRLVSVLDFDYDLACWLADCWPSDLRDAETIYMGFDEARLQRAFLAFREALLR